MVDRSRFFSEGINPDNNGILPDKEDKIDLKPSPLTLSPMATLTDLVRDYTFFTYAPLLLYGKLPFDPLTQFIQEHGQLSDGPHLLMSKEPIFDGLISPEGDSSLNHVLFGVPNKYWTELALHLGSIGIKDSTAKTYYNVEMQSLPMVDYLALRHMPILPSRVPMIDVYLTAMDGNKECLHFLPAISPPMDKIKLVKSKPKQSTIEFAISVFAGNPNIDLMREKK